jgi:diguanylate cyclase (GGDEF)-like protein
LADAGGVPPRLSRWFHWPARCALALTATGLAAASGGDRLPLVAVLALGPLGGAARLSVGMTAALAGYALVWAAFAGFAGHALTAAAFLVPAGVTLAAGVVAVGVARSRRQYERRAAQLRRLASVDSLTGLDSRRAVMEYAASLTAIRPPRRPAITLALVDLDHFKSVNDKYGHLAGDAVLAEVGRRVRRCLRASDRAGRYGGEELLLVLPDTDEAGALRLVERLLHVIRHTPVDTPAGPLRVTASAGVATGGRVEQLLARADTALYAAKAAGRNQASVAPRHVVLPEDVTVGNATSG